MTTARRKPQDHKPKTGAFTFSAEVVVPATQTQPEKTVRKTFTLPPPGEASKHVKGRVLRDAAMNPNDGGAQLRLNIAILEASGVPPETLDAIYDMDSDAMNQIIGDWLKSERGDGSVPQS